MRKMLIVAAREYNATVRTKAFLISLVLMPVLMGGSVLIPLLVKDRGETRAKHVLVVDRSPDGRLFTALETALQLSKDAGANLPGAAFVLERVEPSAAEPDAVRRQRFELSERIRQREAYAILELGAEVYRNAGPADLDEEQKLPDTLVLRYQSNSPLSRDFPRWAELVLNQVIQERRSEDAGLPFAKVQAVQQKVPLVGKGLTRRHPTTGAIEDGRDDNPLVSFLLPYGLLFLMFMMVFLGGTPLMQGVVEEKMQRIAEVLLGSVRPFELMLGKLLGTVGVSLTLSAVYLSCAFGAAYYYGFTDYVSAELMAWFMLFQVLGVLMYGSLFIAIGAACTSTQETQTLLMPVMLTATLPLLFVAQMVREPDSTLMRWLSLFPPATPMMMTARVAIPPGVAWWQPALGATVLLAATLLCVYAAGRIFRVGLLLQGKGASYRDLVRWVLRG